MNFVEKNKKIILIDVYEKNPFYLIIKDVLIKKKYKVKIFRKSNFINKKDNFDIVNCNWVIEKRLKDKGILKSIASSIYFCITILFLKMKKKKTSWTMHNIYPHDTSLKIGYYYANKILFKLMDEIIVMSSWQKNLLEKDFYVPSKKIRVFYHGNYINYYKNNISRQESRKILNIKKNAFVYLFLGNIKPYKNIPYLIKEFNKIKNNNDVLLIAGKAEKEIRKEIENSKNDSVKIFPYYINDNDVQIFMNASDVSVLPFKEITNSGSVLLSMSFGKPIICPRKGSLPEYVSEDFGILYNNNIQEALIKIRDSDIKKMSIESFEKAKQLDWSDWDL